MHVAARSNTGRLTLALATRAGREAIYRIRHEVYALELGQHSPESECRLTDSLDEFNTYIIGCLPGSERIWKAAWARTRSGSP